MRHFILFSLSAFMLLCMAACGVADTMDVSDKEAFKSVAFDESAGEKHISEEFIGVSEASIDDVKDFLGDNASVMTDDQLDNIVSICNALSIQGLERTMAQGGFPCGCMQAETVVLCNALSIDYEKAWQDGFWTEDEVMALVDQLV